MKRIILLIAVFGGGFFTANSQCANNGFTADGKPCGAITTAVPFLGITGDARSGALGDAGIAISPDANAIGFNASKLAFAEDPLGLSVTYTPWMRALGLKDIYLAYLTGYGKIGESQAITGSLKFFSMGDIDWTDENGESLGQGSPREFEIAVGYARKLGEKLGVSVTGKFIYSNIYTGTLSDGSVSKAGIAGATDIGLTYITPITFDAAKSDLRLGLSIKNIGSKISYKESDTYGNFIPTNLGLGFAWEFNLDEYNQITIIGDANKLLVPSYSIEDSDPEDGIADFLQKSPIEGIFSSFSDAPGGGKEELQEITYSMGLEYWYDKQFAVRAGYFLENANKGGRKYLTFGLGIKYNIFGLNLSYLVPSSASAQRNPLDNTLRFSLLFDLNAFAGE